MKKKKQQAPKIMDHKFIIPLAVGLFVQAAAVVWWLAGLSASVQHNDFQIKMLASLLVVKAVNSHLKITVAVREEHYFGLC